MQARRTDSRGTDELSLEERTEAALAYAISGDWKHAVTENQAIIDADPANTEAANRLGKAFIELNKPRKAEEAYQLTLDHDPSNAIARKNLDRLAAARKTGARGAKSAKAARVAKATKRRSRGARDVETISPSAMIEAASTAREFTLERPELDELAKLDVGDGARLEETERGVAVRSLTGALLGQIEPRPGLRLRRLIEGGNRYAVI
ncbi:MAG: tetratricopeptide repeat protein, partial [Dehalococcoidia bacterium]